MSYVRKLLFPEGLNYKNALSERVKGLSQRELNQRNPKRCPSHRLFAFQMAKIRKLYVLDRDTAGHRCKIDIFLLSLNMFEKYIVKLYILRQHNSISFIHYVKYKK
jgi:hypothetical protein